VRERERGRGLEESLLNLKQRNRDGRKRRIGDENRNGGHWKGKGRRWEGEKERRRRMRVPTSLKL
jgi:hypothetical protein